MNLSRDSRYLRASVNRASRKIARPAASARAKFRPRLSSRSGTVGDARGWPDDNYECQSSRLHAGLYASERNAHAWEQRLSSSRSSPLAAVVGHRTRGRSKINGRGGYMRSLLAAATASEDQRGRGRITAHVLYLRCIPKPPTANHPRTHVAV